MHLLFKHEAAFARLVNFSLSDNPDSPLNGHFMTKQNVPDYRGLTYMKDMLLQAIDLRWPKLRNFTSEVVLVGKLDSGG